VSRRDEDRLADILESIDRIRGYRGRGADAAVFDAILYRLLVLGEAAGSLSDETIAAAPEIEWRAIVALRNRLAHTYWRISLPLIDEILEADIDPLERAVRRLLGESSNE